LTMAPLYPPANMRLWPTGDSSPHSLLVARAHGASRCARQRSEQGSF
jgi:hypothetical protein